MCGNNNLSQIPTIHNVDRKVFLLLGHMFHIANIIRETKYEKCTNIGWTDKRGKKKIPKKKTTYSLSTNDHPNHSKYVLSHVG